MALKPFASAVCALGLLAAGCALPEAQATPVPEAALRIEDPPARANLPLSLLVMPLANAAAQLRHALVSEVQDEINVRTLLLEHLTANDLCQAVFSGNVSGLVLIDNRSVTLYRDCQASMPADTVFPPALVLMAAFAEESQRSLRNASVISYEVPCVSAVVALRSLIQEPVRRVGVVYRRPFVDFVEHNRKLAKVENVELVGIPVDVKPTANQVGWALHRLVERDAPVDALWVLNDNTLLSPALMRDVWLPFAHEQSLPIVVGVDALVSRSLDFGSLAVVPDLDAMGLQAAQHLLSLAAQQWQGQSSVEPPISVSTVVDATQAEDLFTLRPEALDGVNRVIR